MIKEYMREYNREYYAKNQKREKERSRKYRLANREYYLTYAKEWHKKNDPQHREEINARCREYYYLNKNKRKVYQHNRRDRDRLLGRIRRQKHGFKGFDTIAEYERDYRQRNMGYRESNREYAKRRKEAGVLTIETLQRVYEDNIKKYGTLTCEYCKNPIKLGLDTLEHKIPLSRGGTNYYENLAVACKSCNSRKKDKTPEEFQVMLEKEKEVCL